ncbi:helix-turn-helix transcriptional regulator [Pedobacter sp. N36a]|uniref:winged helix-turn-helix transcriptional regulator n=1 Tax=Pedobacter sp. N36a TaxID=2767996 RepID=UPI00165699CB|nr:helix-turn-helix domain-containing protein [Pedobacter sp. N36a]MBC8985015.1 helix-turn-helix transcriptional regulator [Pedobacter sp. N36a]
MKTKLRITENKICPLEHAVNTISGKWKIPIVWHLHQGVKRPADFFLHIADMNRRVLTRQLKELEESGIIFKTIIKEKPLEVEYELSSSGNQLVAALWNLNDWGIELLKPVT